MIDRYIKWGEIWQNEICLKTVIDDFEDNNQNFVETIKQFQNEKDIRLMSDECVYQPLTGQLIFFFGVTGGQNESDNQGWSRDYTFVVDEDFMIIDVEYNQG